MRTILTIIFALLTLSVMAQDEPITTSTIVELGGQTYNRTITVTPVNGVADTTITWVLLDSTQVVDYLINRAIDEQQLQAAQVARAFSFRDGIRRFSESQAEVAAQGADLLVEIARRYESVYVGEWRLIETGRNVWCDLVLQGNGVYRLYILEERGGSRTGESYSIRPRSPRNFTLQFYESKNWEFVQQEGRATFWPVQRLQPGLWVRLQKEE